jgi:hypothetical protein
MSREKPSHKRLQYRWGKTEQLVLERDLSNANYRIIHYKKGGVGIVQYRSSTKEATELFNELLKELK